jgi:hypothetical protein
VQEQEIVCCGVHGEQQISFACTHIAHGLLDGTSPGFVCYPERGEAYPLAWCRDCEIMVEGLGGDWSGEARARAGFKMLCVACYLEARDLARDCGRYEEH